MLLTHWVATVCVHPRHLLGAATYCLSTCCFWDRKESEKELLVNIEWHYSLNRAELASSETDCGGNSTTFLQASYTGVDVAVT